MDSSASDGVASSTTTPACQIDICEAMVPADGSSVDHERVVRRWRSSKRLEGPLHGGLSLHHQEPESLHLDAPL
jgi:hypothetical protein